MFGVASVSICPSLLDSKTSSKLMSLGLCVSDCAMRRLMQSVSKLGSLPPPDYWKGPLAGWVRKDLERTEGTVVDG